MGDRIAILASGEGTVAQSLLDASASGDLAGGQVVLVVSDRAEAGALNRGRRADIEALFVDPRSFDGRAEFCAGLAREIERRDISLVCLAGFMRILTGEFVRPFAGRILNTHPALLPSFPGAHPVRDAFEWGVKVTGATIHIVDEEVDHGPIVAQEAVTVLAGDDEESLHRRIKQVERRIYPEAVRAILAGRVVVEGRRVKGNR